MIRAIVASAILLIATAAALGHVLTGDSQATAVHPTPTPTTYPADGSVRYHRLPWRDGASTTFNQGWQGAFSHTGQYATDWGNGGVTFAVYSASEGDAQCTLNAGEAGNVIKLTRNGGKSEKYVRR